MKSGVETAFALSQCAAEGSLAARVCLTDLICKYCVPFLLITCGMGARPGSGTWLNVHTPQLNVCI